MFKAMGIATVYIALILDNGMPIGIGNRVAHTVAENSVVYLMQNRLRGLIKAIQNAVANDRVKFQFGSACKAFTDIIQCAHVL